MLDLVIEKYTLFTNNLRRRNDMAKEMVAMILAGGQGSRLYALTQNLAKPAVPFGGKYRIIDFPLSNCVNSGIDTVGILTQYQPLVLNEYIGNGQPWDLDRLYGGVHVLPPYQQATGSDWYKGTANAIYQNLSFIRRYDPQYVIILSGDQICKQDYNDFLKFHKEKGAEFSVAVMEVPWDEASRFGLMVADENSQITEFQEKPKEPKSNLASMGIYIFNRDILEKYLTEDEANPESSNDFGNDVIPALLRDHRKMFAYRFDGYWKDVGTISSLWEANMEIIDPEHSGINLFDDDWKIYSRNSGLPGHKIGANAVIENAMITNGCRINGHVNHSILFAGVTVEEGADVQDAVVMDNVVIKAGAKVRHCIVGENAVIGANTIVGAMPADGENGVATVGPGVKVGDNAVIGPKAMINSDVKDGDTQW
jgi:glucose-1-phosphate adenylyltransferase